LDECGGPFNANSAHPFEILPVNNFLEILLILLIPFLLLTHSDDSQEIPGRDGFIYNYDDAFIVFLGVMYWSDIMAIPCAEAGVNGSIWKARVSSGLAARFFLLSAQQLFLWRCEHNARLINAIGGMSRCCLFC